MWEKGSTEPTEHSAPGSPAFLLIKTRVVRVMLQVLRANQTMEVSPRHHELPSRNAAVWSPVRQMVRRNTSFWPFVALAQVQGV